MATTYDGGYKGQLMSLAGMLGAPGYGMTVECTSVSVAAGATSDVIAANPYRVWMILTNLTAGLVHVALGSYGALTTNLAIVLQQYDSLIINKDLPWTGPISMYAPGGAITVGKQEASLTRAASR